MHHDFQSDFHKSNHRQELATRAIPFSTPYYDGRQQVFHDTNSDCRSEVGGKKMPNLAGFPANFA